MADDAYDAIAKVLAELPGRFGANVFSDRRRVVRALADRAGGTARDPRHRQLHRRRHLRLAQLDAARPVCSRSTGWRRIEGNWRPQGHALPWCAPAPMVRDAGRCPPPMARRLARCRRPRQPIRGRLGRRIGRLGGRQVSASPVPSSSWVNPPSAHPQGTPSQGAYSQPQQGYSSGPLPQGTRDSRRRYTPAGSQPPTGTSTARLRRRHRSQQQSAQRHHPGGGRRRDPAARRAVRDRHHDRTDAGPGPQAGAQAAHRAEDRTENRTKAARRTEDRAQNRAQDRTGQDGGDQARAGRSAQGPAATATSAATTAPAIAGRSRLWRGDARFRHIAAKHPAEQCRQPDTQRHPGRQDRLDRAARGGDPQGHAIPAGRCAGGPARADHRQGALHLVWRPRRQLQRPVQTSLSNELNQLTNGRKDFPIVFFCQGVRCWESYNAVLRAWNAGYRNVYWYRGGLQAWQQAGFPMAQTPPSR